MQVPLPRYYSIAAPVYEYFCTRVKVIPSSYKRTSTLVHEYLHYPSIRALTLPQYTGTYTTPVYEYLHYPSIRVLTLPQNTGTYTTPVYECLHCPSTCTPYTYADVYQCWILSPLGQYPPIKFSRPKALFLDQIFKFHK